MQDLCRSSGSGEVFTSPRVSSCKSQASLPPSARFLRSLRRSAAAGSLLRVRGALAIPSPFPKKRRPRTKTPYKRPRPALLWTPKARRSRPAGLTSGTAARSFPSRAQGMGVAVAPVLCCPKTRPCRPRWRKRSTAIFTRPITSPGNPFQRNCSTSCGRSSKS